MAAIATLPVLFSEGIHSARPAASAVGSGGLYSCTTHSLIYQTDGSTWTTWATLGGTPVDDATISTSDITTNNASTSKHGWLKKLDNNAAHFMDGTGAWSTPGGSGGLTVATTYLSGSTVNVTSGADATIVSLASLAAGTWDITAHVCLQAGAGGADYYYWVDDGSTVYGSGQSTIPGTSWVETTLVFAFDVVLGSPTTMNLKGRSSGATGVAQITTPNGTKGKATCIHAVKTA